MTEGSGYKAGGVNVNSSIHERDKMPMHIRTVQTQNPMSYDRRSAASSGHGNTAFRTVKLRGE